MQVRGWVIFALALVMGGVAAFLANTYIQQQVSVQKQGLKADVTIPVVVAKENLAFGDPVTADKLAVVNFPKSVVPEGAFSTASEVLGNTPAVALRQMKANEVVLPYKLSPHGARGGLPAKIPEDMRAVTIGVNEVRGVAGFVRPSDYVDILHTTKEGRADKKMATRVILQNVKVLGVDQTSKEDTSEPIVVNAVTLLVSQVDGQRLILAQKLGDLNLLLRNEFDGSLLEEQVVLIKDLLIIEPPVKKVKVRKRYRRPQVEVIRGLRVEKKEVPEGKVPSPAPAKKPETK